MSKKNVKKIISCLVVCAMVIGSSAGVFAEHDDIGEIIKTKAIRQETYNEPDSDTKITTMGGAGSYSITIEDLRTTSNRRLKEMEFVRYLTNSWAPSDGYTWSESNSTSLSFSIGISSVAKKAIKSEFGLSGGYRTTYTVATHVPADENRFSKLAFASDYYVQDVAYTEVIRYSGASSGVVRNDYNVTYEEPTEDTYLYPKYKY